MEVFVIVVGILVLAGLLVGAISSGADRTRRHIDVDARLAALFDDSPPVVHYTETRIDLPAETVIDAAVERGYRVEADQQTASGPRRLTFVRRDGVTGQR